MSPLRALDRQIIAFDLCKNPGASSTLQYQRDCGLARRSGYIENAPEQRFNLLFMHLVKLAHPDLDPPPTAMAAIELGMAAMAAATEREQIILLLCALPSPIPAPTPNANVVHVLCKLTNTAWGTHLVILSSSYTSTNGSEPHP